MKKIIAALAGAFILCSTQAAAVTDLDHIVAVVNDDVIVKSELESRLKSIKSQLRQRQAKLPPEDSLRQQVLDRLVQEHLQLQVAGRTGIRVDDTQLNTAMRNIAQQNKLSLDQFRATLERDGFSFAQVREEIRTEMIISQLRQRQVTNRISISDAEIDSFLEKHKGGSGNTEYHLAHILISVPEAASPEQIGKAELKAAKVIDEVRAEGGDFARAAAQYSDAQQALEGGDLGWRKRSEIPSLFVDVVTTMQAGDVSDAIRSPSGFHIIKLTETRGAGAQSIITQTRVRHILLRPDELTGDTEAQARLNQYRSQVMAGEDFSALARAHSQDPGSGSKGGELGWVNPGQLVPQFEKVMNALKPGEISEPFRSPFGWHIVQTLERRDYDNTKEVSRKKARSEILKQRSEEETQAWLRRMRDEAYVDVRI